MPCLFFSDPISPAAFVHHLDNHSSDFLSLLEFCSDFFPPGVDQDAFQIVSRFRNDVTCGELAVDDVFRTRIMGQLALPVRPTGSSQEITVKMPDWTAFGWDKGVFHEFWARQLGVLAATERDFEIRALLDQQPLNVDSWTSGASIKLNVHTSTAYVAPSTTTRGLLSETEWSRTSLLPPMLTDETFIFDCTLHCCQSSPLTASFSITAVEMQRLVPKPIQTS
ncbi:hypothetical protein C8J57DRAFT_1492376 [Mycena rebaudengoi]|nr:hypothetical protein C8J57DRAFT_1492376 [Mycena rebaudengoi]